MSAADDENGETEPPEPPETGPSNVTEAHGPEPRKGPSCVYHPDREAIAWFHTFDHDVLVCSEELAKHFGKYYPAYMLDGRKVFTVVNGSPVPDPMSPRRKRRPLRT